MLSVNDLESAMENALNVNLFDTFGNELDGYTWYASDFQGAQSAGATTVTGYQGSRLTLQLNFTIPLNVSNPVRELHP